LRPCNNIRRISILGKNNMEIIEKTTNTDHEKVLYARDSESGYRGFIAIHSTVLGPAIGGTRFWNYASEEEALTDVLRLARGMTYKNALPGLPLGGGKSTIIGDNKTPNREALFRAHGRFVESLGGLYMSCRHGDCPPGNSSCRWITRALGRSLTIYGAWRVSRDSGGHEIPLEYK
jgi:leucine dehydrogenase